MEVTLTPVRGKGSVSHNHDDIGGAGFYGKNILSEL